MLEYPTCVPQVDEMDYLDYRICDHASVDLHHGCRIQQAGANLWKFGSIKPPVKPISISCTLVPEHTQGNLKGVSEWQQICQIEDAAYSDKNVPTE